MRILLFTLMLVLCSCQSSHVKLTDRYEKGAFVEVPEHIDVLKINGRRIRGSIFGGVKKIEIPEGRTEMSVRFTQMYDTYQGDSHEEVISDKMTFVFVAQIGNHYIVKCPNPETLKEAKKLMSSIKASLLERETGDKTEAVIGYIEERRLEVIAKKPYAELKHWWNKATRTERENFLKWIKDPR